MKIWGVIPARAGSKGVPNKNIRLLGGFPLITYSIQASNMSKRINRTIVSTDCMNIGLISRRWGAEVPFFRPSELASDTATDLGWVLHLLKWANSIGDVPDLLVHLRPTTPFRDPTLIDDAIEKYLFLNGELTSMRSAHELSEHPYKMFIKEQIYFKPFGQDLSTTNLPRQSFEKVYVPNGYVDILDVKHILETNTLHGNKILAFETKPVIEIDGIDDLIQAEYEATQANPLYSRLVSLF